MAALTADASCVLARASCQQGQPSPLLTIRDVQEIVEKKVRRPDFLLLSWRMQPVVESNGYLGQYYNLQTTVAVDDRVMTFKFFAKTPPPSDSPHYDFLFRSDSFNKEVIVYTELMREMGTGSGQKWMADCYLCKKDIIIVLEDATADGFVTLDKLEPLDEEHCVLGLKALARFHSRSLIFDEKRRRAGGPTIYELYGHILKEALYLEGDKMTERMLYSSLVGCKAMIDLDERLSDEQKVRLKERVSVWASKLIRLLDKSEKHRNAICHRDVWANNLMFKRDQSGKPSACYLIDFQFTKYCPPTYDLECFLYLTTDAKTRERCRESFMRIYYESLGQAMMEEGFDVDDVLSWEAFKDSCATARNIAIMYALMNLQITLVSREGIAEFLSASIELLEEVFYSDKRADMVRHQFARVPAYKSRLGEIVQEAYKWLPDQPIDN